MKEVGWQGHDRLLNVDLYTSIVNVLTYLPGDSFQVQLIRSPDMNTPKNCINIIHLRQDDVNLYTAYQTINIAVLNAVMIYNYYISNS